MNGFIWEQRGQGRKQGSWEEALKDPRLFVNLTTRFPAAVGRFSNDSSQTVQYSHTLIRYLQPHKYFHVSSCSSPRK